MPKGNSAIPQVGGMGNSFVPRQPMPQGGLPGRPMPPQGGFQPVQPRPGPWPPIPPGITAGPMAPNPQPPQQGFPGMVPPMKPSDVFPAGAQNHFNPFPNVPVQQQGMLHHFGQQRGYSPEKLSRLFSLINNMSAGGQGGR